MFIGTKNLANLYAGVPLADRIGLEDWQLSSIGLLTSGCP